MPAPRARSSTEISCSGRSSSSRSAVSRIARSRSSPLARRARRPRLGASGGRMDVAMAPILQDVERDQRHVDLIDSVLIISATHGTRDRTGNRDRNAAELRCPSRRARRRPDRRRRPLRHRRRLPPAGTSCPARASRSSRRATRSAAPGTSSATRASARTPTCSRSATRFRPWKEAKAIADGPSILQLRPRDRARVRRRPAHPLPPPRRRAPSGRRDDARWTVEAERTDTGETVRLTCGFLFGCTGYYRYDEGFTPRVRGHRALRGRDRPPAALARGPRLRRQARRRDRQRRDRGDARPGDGRAGRARDDAPALAELRRLAARRATRSPTSCAGCCRRRSPTRSCAGRTCCSPRSSSALSRRPAEVHEGADPQGRRAPAARRATTSTRTSSRATTRGTSASAWCPTATSSRRSATAAPRSSPTASRRSPRRGCSSSPGDELEADIIVTATGLNLLMLGGMQIAVDGAELDLPEDRRLQGHDVQRRAEPGIRARLHERVVDAEVRPRRASTSAGCSTTWTSTATAQCTPRAPAPRLPSEPFIDLKSGYVLRSIDDLPEAGRQGAVAAAPELRARRAAAAPRRDRGRGDGVLAQRLQGASARARRRVAVPASAGLTLARRLSIISGGP